MIEIDAAEARRLRARSQLLGGSALAPAEVVARAGALQGQDLGSVLRAIAMRSRPGTGADGVRAAFDAGALVRGWPMRGTLFAITPADLAAIVRITGPRMQAALGKRREHMGVSDAHYALVRETAIEALGQRPHGRDELAARWREAGAPDGPGLAYHFTSTLAIDGVLALGPLDGKDQLVVRLEPSEEDPDAVLVRWVRAFLVARGPATMADLAWWTKLPKAQLTQAMAAIDGVEELRVEGTPMRYLDDGAATADPPRELTVPGFDEWLLGYEDRSLQATPEAIAELVTVNGIFRAARLVDYVAVGRAE